jgi:hypothetical protein
MWTARRSAASSITVNRIMDGNKGRGIELPTGGKRVVAEERCRGVMWRWWSNFCGRQAGGSRSGDRCRSGLKPAISATGRESPGTSKGGSDRPGRGGAPLIPSIRTGAVSTATGPILVYP